MKDQIRKFLSDQLVVTFGDDLDDDSDLFRLGLMDSFSYVVTIRFLERTFALKFSDEELLSTVSVSVTGIAALVEAKAAH